MGSFSTDLKIPLAGSLFFTMYALSLIHIFVVFDENFKLIFSRYERHFSDVKAATIKVFKDFIEEYGDLNLELAITGSGGMGLAEVIDVPFVQEVIASSITIEKFIPQTDVMIELGGEDAKMTFFDNGTQELRMNGTCAGGTGA